MAHHRHAVERGLAVEEHHVAVHQVAIHDVALAEHELLGIDVAQTRDAPIGVANRLRTRVRIRPIANELVELVQVSTVLIGELGHALRESEIHRDFLRNTELGDGDVRVRSNHGARAEFHALALDIVADTALLAPQTLLDGLERPAIALRTRGHTRNLVVYESGYVVLEHVRPLVNDRLGRTSLNAGLEVGIIGLDDLGQLVCEVVLGALVVVLDNTGTNLRRRNGQDRADHPVRATPEAIQAEKVHVLVSNTTEEAEHVLHLQALLLLLAVAVGVLPLGHNARNSLAHVAVRLTSTTAVLRLLATALNLLGRRENLAVPRLPTALQIMLAEVLVHEELRAPNTDTGQDVLHEGQELDVIDGAGEAEVAEMAGTLVIRLPTASALLTIVKNTHAGIEQTPDFRLCALICAGVGDLYH